MQSDKPVALPVYVSAGPSMKFNQNGKFVSLTRPKYYGSAVLNNGKITITPALNDDNVR